MALFLNLILSGSGLILRRREWLGLSMAMIFAICGHVAIAGWLIAPEAVPHWLTRLAVLLGVLTWVLSQFLFYRQGRILARMKLGLASLLSEARRALENDDLTSARRALDNGVMLDDENVELHAMRARLSVMEGDDRGMQAEWRRVLELDRGGRYHADAEAALRLGAGDPPRAGAV